VIRPLRRLRAACTTLLCAGLLLVGVAQGVLAVQPGEMLSDPTLEARARAISTEIRCLVCQNQSIDDSDAPLAQDLRVLVRERLKAGDTDTAVRDFVVSRYGAFVLLRPPLTRETLLLWFGPLVVLLLAIAGIVFSRRRHPPKPIEGLSDDEEARLARLLAEAAPPEAAAPTISRR
jgi:cytochrome c-type biogenesis protein CcmH